MSGGLLCVVVCGAGPAGNVGRLVDIAQAKGYAVQILATPAALGFIDITALEAQTGRPVRSDHRAHGEPRSSRSERADAFIVAPATFNTINKLANGISDTYVLDVLAECLGVGVPIIMLPFVNAALAGRAPFRRSVEALRAEGVRVLIGPGGFEPHPPRTGDTVRDRFPWHLALDQVERYIAG